MTETRHYRGLSLTRSKRKIAVETAGLHDLPGKENHSPDHMLEIHPRHIGKMDRYRELNAGMAQHVPTEAELRQQLNDSRPMTAEQIEWMSRGQANAGLSRHEHVFCSWIPGAVVFPGGEQLAFPCTCGAMLAHMSDGRYVIDYTGAVKYAEKLAR